MCDNYVLTSYRAIIRPKMVISLTTATLVPESNYMIVEQQMPTDNSEGLKRNLIQGIGVRVWFGMPIEEYFDVVEVLSQ